MYGRVHVHRHADSSVLVCNMPDRCNSGVLDGAGVVVRTNTEVHGAVAVKNKQRLLRSRWIEAAQSC